MFLSKYYWKNYFCSSRFSIIQISSPPTLADLNTIRRWKKSETRWTICNRSAGSWARVHQVSASPYEWSWQLGRGQGLTRRGRLWTTPEISENSWDFELFVSFLVNLAQNGVKRVLGNENEWRVSLGYPVLMILENEKFTLFSSMNVSRYTSPSENMESLLANHKTESNLHWLLRDLSVFHYVLHLTFFSI